MTACEFTRLCSRILSENENGKDQSMVYVECERIANHGGILLSGMKDDGDAMLTAKACIHVALLNLAESYKPLSVDGKKIASNLKRF